MREGMTGNLQITANDVLPLQHLLPFEASHFATHLLQILRVATRNELLCKIELSLLEEREVVGMESLVVQMLLGNWKKSQIFLNSDLKAIHEEGLIFAKIIFGLCIVSL
jgi:hypothetical protein